jgi:glutathione peroxidase
MTLRQRILKMFYPLLMKFSHSGKKASAISNNNNIIPPDSLYNYSIELNNVSSLPLSEFRGKKIMFVNTASDCGYTAQYAELQELFEKRKDRLQIIGFPSNDFHEQEKGSDAEIAKFCQVNYGVKFPLAKKAAVRVREGQQPIYQWLTNAKKNGWNEKEPSWNFSKYLINENGVLTHIFAPDESPMGENIQQAIQQ